MPNRYFEKFPTVSYNGFDIRNLTTSAKVINKYVNLPYNYQQSYLDEDQRVDTVASEYYDDPYMSWIVYYANGIVDPYYGWHLSDDDFNSYIVNRYGSVESAQRRIVQFVPNWFSDQREVLPAQYEAMFGTYKEPHSKYWNPVFNDDSGSLLYYVRKQSNNAVNTNKLMCVRVANNDPSKFAAGDLVDIKTSYNSPVVGNAKVEKANTTTVFISCIIGDIANGNLLVTENDPTRYAQVTAQSNTQDLTQQAWTIVNIPEEEYVYWSPMTVYDVETEQNNVKKSIRLIEPTLALKLADKLGSDLGE